jgi:hypothetical protein
MAKKCFNYQFGDVKQWLVCEIMIFYINFMVLLILLLNSYLRSDKKKKEERDNLYCEFVERLKKENDEKPLLSFTSKKNKCEPLIKIINTTEIQ